MRADDSLQDDRRAAVPDPATQRARRGRRRVASAAIGAAAVVALSATGAGATTGGHASGAVDIQLWESHNGGPVGGAMTTLVNKFNATQKNAKVTIVVTKASSKLEAALAAGDAPVLAEISHYDGVFVKAGALVSWNPFMRNSTVVTKKNLLPTVWANGVVKGQHYRLQADLKVSEVFYNKDLFKKAGITAAPTTWSELATDAAKLKHLGVIPLGWKDSSAHILPAIMSNGGTLLRGSNTVGNSVAFDTPAARATFNFFRRLYGANELQFHHGTTLREDLAAGKMAMIDGTSAGYAKVLAAVSGKFPVGAFVEPAGSTGHAANLAQGLGFVLPKGHTHAQDEAAWSFVQWWFEPAQQALWAKLTGFDPETHSGIAAIPAGYLKTHPGLAASISAAVSPYTVPRPVSDSYNEVQASIDAEFFNAVTGKQSVSSALRALQQQGNSYMKGASEL
ncbi:MAG: extracellular solute-binding protein [Actinomycetota bacterium]|nr:extracellular solute-binding protein [Actinomycetota bacterium]